MDAGETFAEAAMRETMEEAGMLVELKGVLGISTCPGVDRRGNCYMRMWVIFYAEPVMDVNQIPKSIPDFESAGAAWCSVDDILSSGLKLRGREPKQWVKYLQKGGEIYPMSILSEDSRR